MAHHDPGDGPDPDAVDAADLASLWRTRVQQFSHVRMQGEAKEPFLKQAGYKCGWEQSLDHHRVKK